MKRSEFEKLLKRIDKESFWEFYRTHSIRITGENFDITSSTVERIAKEYGLKKSPEDIRLTSINTCMEKYGVTNVAKLPEIIKKIDEVKRANGSYDNQAEKLQAAKIKKHGSIEAAIESMLRNQQKALVEKYGSLEKAYAKQQEARLKTMQQRYGCDNPFQVPGVKEKIKKTSLDKFGVEYPNQCKEVQDKIFQSTLNSCGPDNFNNWKQGQQTRILNSGSLEASYQQGLVKQRKTNLERYGAECVLVTPHVVSFSKKKNSTPNIAFANLLKRYKVEFQQEFVIESKSFDFKCGNTLIEIDPSISHNITSNPFYTEKPFDKTYHAEKSALAEKHGYRCIHIWDWDNAELLVQQFLVPRTKVYARQCVVKEVSGDTAKSFINSYHLQGDTPAKIRLGLFHEDTLVAIMTFGAPRYNKNYEYELIRYCSSCNIVGGSKKLFTYFIRHYQPTSIVSYCDRSKFVGDTYNKLGFVEINKSISSHWYNMKTKQHILDSTLRKRGFDQLFGTNYGKGTSNRQLMIDHGFVEIFDCGQATYSWKLD